MLRLDGGDDLLSWMLVVLGVLLVCPFALWELRNEDPLIDVRMFRSPALGPVFLTAGLFGVSVLGAQAPLSTFARTDPARLRLRPRHDRLRHLADHRHLPDRDDRRRLALPADRATRLSPRSR